jgi:hypothetical protein
MLQNTHSGPMPPTPIHNDPVLFAIECDLPTDIHPILAQENWIFEDFERNAALWNDLQPALRLVTQMLTHDSPLLWYTHTMFGALVEESYDYSDCIRQYLHGTPGSWNLAALDTVRHNLAKAAGLIKLASPTPACLCYRESMGQHAILRTPCVTYQAGQRPVIGQAATHG